MKRKISFAFVLMCLISLFSVTSIVGIIPGIINQFRNFKLLSFVGFLSNVVNTFLPIGIAALLYLNRQKDVKKKIYTILIVGGIAKLVSVVAAKPWVMFVSVFSYTGLLVDLVIGVLLLLVAVSVKKETTTGVVQGFAFFGIFLGVFAVIANLMGFTFVGMGLRNAIITIMMALALWCLPKTTYHYDECFFFDGWALRLTIAIVLVIVFVIVVVNGLTKDSTKRGNCFNCNGTGYDSDNSCSCVWCGGDGNASWNP